MHRRRFLTLLAALLSALALRRAPRAAAPAPPGAEPVPPVRRLAWGYPRRGVAYYEVIADGETIAMLPPEMTGLSIRGEIGHARVFTVRAHHETFYAEVPCAKLC